MIGSDGGKSALDLGYSNHAIGWDYHVSGSVASSTLYYSSMCRDLHDLPNKCVDFFVSSSNRAQSTTSQDSINLHLAQLLSKDSSKSGQNMVCSDTREWMIA